MCESHHLGSEGGLAGKLVVQNGCGCKMSQASMKVVSVWGGRTTSLSTCVRASTEALCV